MTTTTMPPSQAKFLRDQEDRYLAGNPALQPLRDKLMSLGGQFAVLAFREPDLAKILARGDSWRGKPLMRRGEPCRCHSNACALWESCRPALEIVTGYALSDDGIWRQHTWCRARTSRGFRVWETTRPRVLYFGFAMTSDEAREFCDNNFDYLTTL